MIQATYPDLRDRTILVTGAASGLGLAAAHALISQGAFVCIADINFDQLSDLAAQYKAAVKPILLDVTQEQSWKDAIHSIGNDRQHLHAVINSAGLMHLGDVETTSFEKWRQILNVNLDGVFLGCKYSISLMKKTGGSIVNLSSVSGLVGGHNTTAYNASKGGVRLLTKSVALHCARLNYGIRCNSVHPSFVETSMAHNVLNTSSAPERLRSLLEAQVPLGRFATPDDITALILYLCSDVSSFVTGAEFVIDGGLTAQ